MVLEYSLWHPGAFLELPEPQLKGRRKNAPKAVRSEAMDFSFYGSLFERLSVVP